MRPTTTSISAGSLQLSRCPHCRIANPFIPAIHSFESVNSSGNARYQWRLFVCSSCGLPIIGGTFFNHGFIYDDLIFPKPDDIEEGMPKKAETFLRQAIESVHAPSGAIMLCASAVDAMLKAKGLKSGTLYTRIEQAAEHHLITKEMSLWAHEVRLDANDERHADETADLPNESDARRCIEFVKALAEFLFILPGRIERGRQQEVKPATGKAQ